MDAERLRAYLLGLPHVAETMQWGANLVFWVGDKAIGGKMFALVNLDEPADPAAGRPHLLLSYAAGPDRYADLLERDGPVPAPYMADRLGRRRTPGCLQRRRVATRAARRV